MAAGGSTERTRAKLGAFRSYVSYAVDIEKEQILRQNFGSH